MATGVFAERDRAYYRDRAMAERGAAERSSCMVRDVHLELAERYEAMDGAKDAVRGSGTLP